jgi:hypothetical protein
MNLRLEVRRRLATVVELDLIIVQEDHQGLRVMKENLEMQVNRVWPVYQE